MKHYAKRILRRLGYRAINADRRWGVCYTDDVLRIAGHRDAIRTVFDVGANTGATALALSDEFPNARILSFEPSKSTFESLRRNVETNKCIQPIRMALGDYTGQSELTLFQDSGKSSLCGAMSDRLHRDTTGVESIAVTTFDNFASSQKIEHVDLLKIDTEGYDINVMRGATEMLSKGAITFVYAEFHHFFRDTPSQDGLGNLQSMVELLAESNYRLITIYTDSVHPDEDVGTYNALFAKLHESHSWTP